MIRTDGRYTTAITTDGLKSNTRRKLLAMGLVDEKNLPQE